MKLHAAICLILISTLLAGCGPGVHAFTLGGTNTPIKMIQTFGMNSPGPNFSVTLPNTPILHDTLVVTVWQSGASAINGVSDNYGNLYVPDCISTNAGSQPFGIFSTYVNQTGPGFIVTAADTTSVAGASAVAEYSGLAQDQPDYLGLPFFGNSVLSGNTNTIGDYNTNNSLIVAGFALSTAGQTFSFPGNFTPIYVDTSSGVSMSFITGNRGVFNASLSWTITASFSNCIVALKGLN